MGWRNSSFRGFADYMQTQEFVEGIDQLVGLAQEGQVAIMCAEVLPWRCHRWLIADVLLVRGVQVGHIMTIKTRSKHKVPRLFIQGSLEQIHLQYVNRNVVQDVV